MLASELTQLSSLQDSKRVRRRQVGSGEITPKPRQPSFHFPFTHSSYQMCRKMVH